MTVTPDSPTVNDPLMAQFGGVNYWVVFRQSTFSQVAPLHSEGGFVGCVDRVPSTLGKVAASAASRRIGATAGGARRHRRRFRRRLEGNAAMSSPLTKT